MTWMSQPAYPSLVWQTYDYYLDPTGAYWGIRKACEPVHIQWSHADNSVKAVNTTREPLEATATARVYDLDGRLLPQFTQQLRVSLAANTARSLFDLNFSEGNLARNRPVKASSSSPDGAGAGALTDGNDSSRWASEYSDDQWIEVDLGERRAFTEVVLRWEDAHAAAYKLQLSDDGRTWRDVYETQDAQGGEQTIPLPLQQARYVRMLGLRRATQWGYSLYEMEVYRRDAKAPKLSPVHFIRLELTDRDGRLLSDNFYWHATRRGDYTALNTLAPAKLQVRSQLSAAGGRKVIRTTVRNVGRSVAFAVHVQPYRRSDGERILPYVADDNYFTLLQGESRQIDFEFDAGLLPDDRYTVRAEAYMKRTLLYLLLLPALLSGTCLLAAGPAGNAGHGAKPCLRRLTCEGLTDPLAIDTATPRFGWQLRSGRRGDAQRSYRIEVASDSLRLLAGDADLWDSGWVRSKRSVGVAYEGLPLTARTQCWWRVTARTEKGNRKAVSPVARFGIGLTDPASVSGEFIGCPESGATAVLLRRAFTLPACGDEALLHVNSLGYHEIWVNGRKVGDACLAPALSQLDKRSLWVTYDVRPYLLEGDNELVIWLGQGWYKRGTFGRWQPDEPYTEPLVRAQLDIGTANTWQTACRTDTAWRAALSGYRDTGSWNALDFGGEEIDARRNPRSMSPSDLDALAWQPVITARKPGHRATPQMVEPDRIQERLTARVLDEAAPGVWRIDFGKVVTGWLEAHFSGLPDGARVEIEYSDETDGDGNLIDQRQRDTYIARGDGRERFCNKFNHHAFRYAEVRGLAQRPRREDFRALAIHTDYRPEATFTSSDSDLNAIHDMIAHTLRCLAYNGYMVDCPHLERAGYGGDGNSSTEILQTLCGAAPLYRNWVQAWDDAMRPGGSLPHVAPNAGAGGGGPYWCGFIVMAPWQTWLNYGDRTLVDRHYPAMREWMGYVERYMKDGLLTRWPDTPYRDWFLGDWLAPHGVDTGSEASVSLVNNCFVSDCYARMAQMARLTGHDDEAAAFEARREALNRTIHARFYDPATQTYATGSQLDMTYPMLVGATPDSLRAGVEQRLFRLTHDVMKDHIGGGLVGVPVITRWAVRSHNPEFIYRMLKQRGYPGYLHMIDHGATATWEYWSGERSRVHNCYNGIGTWFYQALGGLRTDSSHPGYEHVFIDPQIPEGVEWCRIGKETPYGRIDLGWEIADGELRIDVTLPPGVTATAITPAGACRGRLDGRRLAPQSPGTKIASGRHRLVFGLAPQNERQ